MRKTYVSLKFNDKKFHGKVHIIARVEAVPQSQKEQRAHKG